MRGAIKGAIRGGFKRFIGGLLKVGYVATIGAPLKGILGKSLGIPGNKES